MYTASESAAGMMSHRYFVVENNNIYISHFVMHAVSVRFSKLSDGGGPVGLCKNKQFEMMPKD